MKLIDAINRVERPKTATLWQAYSMNIDQVCSALGIHDMWDYDEELYERLHAYPIFDWYCTDETVGLYAIYLDGEPVGAYYRSGRKMGYQFMWLSQATGEKVRNVLLSYSEPDDFDVIDPDTQIESFRYLGDSPCRLKVEPTNG